MDKLGVPICLYCKAGSILVTGKVIYPHRPDLKQKHFWHCAPCDAYVGCHPDTTVALGRLANAELRRAKQDAHAVFDKLWRRRLMTRTAAYKMLAGQLGIQESQCHIGMFDVETCQKVIELAKRISI